MKKTKIPDKRHKTKRPGHWIKMIIWFSWL